MGNITFFAPSNNAINLLVQNPAGFALANEPDIVAAFLEYHVLNGAYNSSTFPTMETFLPSLLTNTSYTSITSGQVVGVSKNGSTVDILSGLLQTSHVVIAVSLSFVYSSTQLIIDG
jgi:transforming growth factor-beta-induced protein